MVAGDSIFYNITSENENTCTQVLANMMSTKFVRDIVLRYLCGNDINEILKSISKNHIATQASFGDNGRPDIVIQNKECCIYIENKILGHTGLTQNQPDGYFNELKKQNINFRKLIFILPDNYNHEDELDGRIERLKCDAKDNNITIYIRKWSGLFEELSREEIDAKSVFFSESLNYLKSVVYNQPAEDTTVLTSSETSLFYEPDRIIRLSQKLENIRVLTDNAISNLKNTWNLNLECIDWFNKYGIGKGVVINNELRVFLGLNPCIGKEYVDYAFSMAFWYKEPIILKGQSYDFFTPNMKEEGGYWTYFKLNMTKELLLTYKQDELNDVVNQLYSEVTKELRLN